MIRTKKPTHKGNCYVTCEALYHLMGGKVEGLTPMYVKHEGVTHWFLKLNTFNHWASDVIIDPTKAQFKTRVPYELGIGCGFLTKKPSKRAKALMKIMLWQEKNV